MTPRRSRLANRLRILAAAAATLGRRRIRPGVARRILVLHNLLLGDTLMLTALLARLRHRHPEAEIALTVAPPLEGLYAGRPYGVRAIPWDPRDPHSLVKLRREPRFDFVFVPGDNRHAVLARALGARWIVALGDDRPAWKNKFCDELIPWPTTPTALGDLFASLAGPGDETYAVDAWPPPPCASFGHPAGDYAVLHVGAGSPLRLWPPERWRALAEHFAARNIAPVWCGGPGDTALVAAIDPERRYANLSGQLDLAQLWHLLRDAKQLVCLDSGIAHLAKLTHTPAVVLYGPGSPLLFGPGRFWRNAPQIPVWDERFPCRDQDTLFKRHLSWVARCQRDPAACAARGVAPRCMEALPLDQVLAASPTKLASSPHGSSTMSLGLTRFKVATISSKGTSA